MKNCHGGDIYSREIKYDFSANINPLGMPERVRAALRNGVDSFEHYPDVRCSALKAAIARRECTGPENIVCGNGAADIIYRLVYALRPRRALVTAPAFSEYEKALGEVGCQVRRFMLSENEDFRLGENIIDEIKDLDMVFICSPNNPTGAVVDNELMKKIAEKCRENNIYLVIDRCFEDFVLGGERMIPHNDKVIVLKAFTKIYAMAGLRLGYALCSIAGRLESCGQCWSVSVPAQIAGAAALEEADYPRRTAELIAAERAYLTRELSRLGFRVFPSEVNFILFRCDLPLDRELLMEGIAIRSCENFVGLGPGYFRIAVRTREENEILINAIERMCKNG